MHNSLHHVAIWVSDLEAAAAFWAKYFDARIGDPYASKRQAGFVSRFATFGDPALKLELMAKPGLTPPAGEHFGWAHLAIALGSKEAVDQMSKRFAAEGRLVLGPRTTGDGFYESVVLGPDDLHIELAI
jgi:lactoylglutathione lyase